MRAAPAEALASPLIARKSQQIVIAMALVAPKMVRFQSPQGSRIEVNSVLSPVGRHLLAE
jgi:hypothetical protein